MCLGKEEVEDPLRQICRLRTVQTTVREKRPRSSLRSPVAHSILGLRVQTLEMYVFPKDRKPSVGPTECHGRKVDG